MSADFLAILRETAKTNLAPVDVPRWGRVYVREITVAEVEAQSADTADKNDKHRIARGAARIMCDAEGKRLIDPDNQDEVNLLASQPWALLNQVIEAANKFNATSADGQEEAKNA